MSNGGKEFDFKTKNKKQIYIIYAYNRVLPFKAVAGGGEGGARSGYPIISITLPMSAKSDYKVSK